MKVRILGQDNPNPTIINGADVGGIEGMLEKFLKHYRENPKLKNLPILLTFDDYEETLIGKDRIFRGINEGDAEYKLRMLDGVVARVNAHHRFVGGFSATFVFETTEGLANGSGRLIGVTYYEFPPYTTATGDNHLPIGNEYAALATRIIPPSP